MDKMKKVTRLMSCILSICILAGSVMTVSATGDANVVIGEKLVFEEGNEPFIANERTMIPLRAVAEALDATVYWFGEEKRVQIVLYDTMLLLSLGSANMWKYKIENGKINEEQYETKELDAPVMISNDRTYVPLRAISEAFNASITWDNPTRSAIIIPEKKTMNNVMLSDIPNLQHETLCSVSGVIERDEFTGEYYLRSLNRNSAGEYSKIKFTTPEGTTYGEYISAFWIEQFGTENPTGMAVHFTGVNNIGDVVSLALSKKTSGIRSLGHYDEYMKSLGLSYEPFTPMAEQ